jgi:hypothetical protein
MARTTHDSPQQVAERHIADWHDSLTKDLPGDFDHVVEEVLRALCCEYGVKYSADCDGKLSDPSEHYLRAHAGYLIGLAVGRRLRSNN